eukprot:GHVN01035683.1.p1 GENE.GHVN01035683.1~~GHVN01035683.1.p1  ORF type:complete len:2169 (+),score=358.42 GHVN01035683.1:491-6997(+)
MSTPIRTWTNRSLVSQPASCVLTYFVPPPYIISVQTMLNYQVQLKLRQSIESAAIKSSAGASDEPSSADASTKRGSESAEVNLDVDGGSNSSDDDECEIDGPQGIPRDDVLGKGIVWPPQMKLQSVPDELKGRLCIFVDNKPAVWDQGMLFRYLRDYFYQRYMIDGKSPPLIADISAYQEKTSAIVVLRDEVSVARMFDCQHIELPPDHQASSGKLSSFLFIRQFVPASHRDRPQKTKTNEPPRWVRSQFQYFNTYRSSLPQSGVFQNVKPVFWPEPRMINEVHHSMQSRLCVEVANVPASWDETCLSNMFFRSLWSMQQEIGVLPPNISAMQCTGDGRAIVACSDELSVHRLLSLRVLYTHPDWSKARPNNLNANDYLLFAPFSSQTWSDDSEPCGNEKEEGTSLTWPCDMAFQDVLDTKLKVVLCCCVKNKPSEWTAPILQRYTEEYIRSAAIPVPCIVGISLPAPHMAIFCCYDEHSVDTLLQVGQMLFPPDWSAHNERQLGQAGNVLSIVEFRVERSDDASKDRSEEMCAIKDADGEEKPTKKPSALTGHGSVERPLVDWPAGKALRDVTDVGLRCRLCVFVFNKPIDWDGTTVQQVLEQHADALSEEFKFSKPTVQLVATVPKAAYALVACSDEVSRKRFLVNRFVHISSVEAQQNQARGFPPYLEIVPLSKGSDWNGIKARFGAAAAQTSRAYEPPLAPPPTELLSLTEPGGREPEGVYSLLQQYNESACVPPTPPHSSETDFPISQQSSELASSILINEPPESGGVGKEASRQLTSLTSLTNERDKIQTEPIEAKTEALSYLSVSGPSIPHASPKSHRDAHSSTETLSSAPSNSQSDRTDHRQSGSPTLSEKRCGEVGGSEQTTRDLIAQQERNNDGVPHNEEATVDVAAMPVKSETSVNQVNGPVGSKISTDRESEADVPPCRLSLGFNNNLDDVEADMETDAPTGDQPHKPFPAFMRGADSSSTSSGLAQTPHTTPQFDRTSKAKGEHPLAAMASEGGSTSSFCGAQTAEELPLELHAALQYAQQNGACLQSAHSPQDIKAVMQAACNSRVTQLNSGVALSSQGEAQREATDEGGEGDEIKNTREAVKSSIDKILTAVQAHKPTAQDKSASPALPVQNPADPPEITPATTVGVTPTTTSLTNPTPINNVKSNSTIIPPITPTISLPRPAATEKAMNPTGRIKASRRKTSASLWHSSGSVPTINPAAGLTWIQSPVSSTITIEKGRSPESSASPRWRPTRPSGSRGRRPSSSRSPSRPPSKPGRSRSGSRGSRDRYKRRDRDKRRGRVGDRDRDRDRDCDRKGKPLKSPPSRSPPSTRSGGWNHSNNPTRSPSRSPSQGHRKKLWYEKIYARTGNEKDERRGTEHPKKGDSKSELTEIHGQSNRQTDRRRASSRRSGSLQRDVRCDKAQSKRGEDERERRGDNDSGSTRDRGQGTSSRNESDRYEARFEGRVGKERVNDGMGNSSPRSPNDHKRETERSDPHTPEAKEGKTVSLCSSGENPHRDKTSSPLTRETFKDERMVGVASLRSPPSPEAPISTRWEVKQPPRIEAPGPTVIPVTHEMGSVTPPMAIPRSVTPPLKDTVESSELGGIGESPPAAPSLYQFDDPAPLGAAKPPVGELRYADCSDNKRHIHNGGQVDESHHMSTSLSLTLSKTMNNVTSTDVQQLESVETQLIGEYAPASDSTLFQSALSSALPNPTPTSLTKRNRSPDNSPATSNVSKATSTSSTTKRQVKQPRNALFSAPAVSAASSTATGTATSSSADIEAHAKKRRTQLAEEWARAQAAQPQQPISPSAIIPVILSSPVSSTQASPSFSAPNTSTVSATGSASRWSKRRSPPSIVQTSVSSPISPSQSTAKLEKESGPVETKAALDRRRFETQLVDFLSTHPEGMDIGSLRKGVPPPSLVSETLREFIEARPTTFLLLGLHVSLRPKDNAIEGNQQRANVVMKIPESAIEREGLVTNPVDEITSKPSTSKVQRGEECIEASQINDGTSSLPELHSGQLSPSASVLATPPISDGRLKGYQWQLVKSPMPVGSPFGRGNAESGGLRELMPTPDQEMQLGMRAMVDSMVHVGVEKHVLRWERKQNKSLKRSNQRVKSVVKTLKQKIRLLQRKAEKRDNRIAEMVQALAERGVPVPNQPSANDDCDSGSDMSKATDSP